MRSFARRSLVVSMIVVGLLSIWVALRVVLRKPPEIPGTLAIIETEAQVYDRWNSLLVRAVTDLDGDGRPEVAVGNPLTVDHLGSVEIFRTDGSRIYAWRGPDGNRVIGHEVRALGDADGDGVDDLWMTERAPMGGTRMRLCSGATGQPLEFGDPPFVLGRPAYPKRGRRSLLSWMRERLDQLVFADFDGDGSLDVAAATDAQDALDVLNGHEGDVQRQIDTPQSFREVLAGLGSYEALEGLGDVDRDGIDDLALSSHRFHEDEADDGELGCVWVVSGADGALLHPIPAPPAVFEFGHWLELVGDVDHDGMEDLAIGGRSFAGVWSLGKRAWSWSLGGTTSWDIVIPGGDIDADGRVDLLALDASSVTVLTASTGRAIAQLVDGRMAQQGLLGRPNAAGVGDVDGDGHGDLAISFTAVVSDGLDLGQLAVPPLSHVLIVSGAEFIKHFGVGP